MKFTVKRFGKEEVITSATAGDGTTIGFRAGSKTTWVVWDNETDKPRMLKKGNGKLTIDSFSHKATAEMQADFLNG